MKLQKNYRVLVCRKNFEIKIEEREMPVNEAWFSEMYGPFETEENAVEHIQWHGDTYVTYLVIPSFQKFV